MALKRFIATNGLDANSKSITNVTDPTDAQDAATKNFASNATNLTSGTVAPGRIAAVIAAGASGLMTGADKTKLDGITAGATANVGTVTSVSVVSANGLAGTVATNTTTPAITLSTSITGILKGNSTAISAASSGVDYSAGTSALTTGIIKSTTTTGALSIAAAGTDYIAPYGSTTANAVLAAPNGSAGTPSFRLLAAADIPSLDWAKITTGKPTTLSGYGIGDAYTKIETDTLLQGLDPKASVKVGTIINATLATAYANASVVDGITLVTGDRILIKDQTAPAENGIYIVAASGVPARAADMNDWLEVPNAYVFVETGTNADKGFVCTSNVSGTLNTTAITWVQFTSAGSYTAGAGLALSSGEFSISNTAVTANGYGSASQVATFTVNAKGQLTAAANTTIAIASTAVSGLATSAITDTTNAANISSGTLPVARLPAFTGDATTVAGASAITLVTQAGVTASSVSGTATSITPFTVNAKGIITATNGAVTIAPLFSSIASKPTTLAGYGITDGLNTTANASVPLTHGKIGSGTLVTTVNTANQILDTNLAASYRSVSYQIQMTSGTAWHYTNVDIMHDDSGNAYASQYGDMMSGASLATLFDASVVTTALNLTISPVNAATTIKFIKTLINV
jgi:hypothetical protein